MKSNKKISIIPAPVKIEVEKGFFKINKDTIILSESGTKNQAIYLKKLLIPATGYDLVINEQSNLEQTNNIIVLELSKDVKRLPPEGYHLNISQDSVTISGSTPKGIFYGIQTLRQLFPPEIESSHFHDIKWSIPCIKIEDYPRFSWRGFMLDESRHFFGKEIVKKLIDLMALLKLNVFHWHLTDDQGWRVEIKKYPLLVEIGSKRKNARLKSIVVKSEAKSDETEYSGFYTQEDLREIINHASERFINIVPEIELPGHTAAVLASYPELSCTGGPFKVSTRYGIHDDVLCIGKEKAFKFVEDVLDEILHLFPSNVIHIGGDEVPKLRWNNCPDCQSRIKQEKLKDEMALQTYFTNRISKYISSKKRIPMGWNEILNDNLVENAICHYWTPNITELLKHIRRGRYVVMSEAEQVYMNFAYNFTSLRKVYEYEPIPKDLEERFHDQIHGIEACLWTEFISDLIVIERLCFPRLLAVAEIGWTPYDIKNYDFFKDHVDTFLKRLQFHDVNYAQKEEYLIEN